MTDHDSWEPSAVSQTWKYVVLHHSATPEGDVAAIDAEHSKRRDQFGSLWPGIGYHFVVGNGQGMSDGRVEPTFRWRQQLHGAHTRSRTHNHSGIGICLVGDFDESPPTPRQLAAVQRLLEWLSARYSIQTRHILRHADVAATRCPGRLFPFADLLDSLDPPLVAASSSVGEELF